MADPKIKYDIEANVSGQGDVGQLATTVEKLAGTLDGELKTSALTSAAALRQLAEKDGAVQNFIELKNKTQQAAAGLKEAQSAAQKLGAELAATANPTRAQTGQMQKLRDAVSSAKVEVVASNSALNQARDGLDKYGINTGNLSQKQIALRQSLGQVRSDVQAMVPAWQESARATASSAESQNRSHRAIKSGVDSISEQLSFLTKAAGAYAAAGQFTGLIKDVAATADAYNNLQARVKLVTGEGAAFETAFEGVSQVAQRTSTSLEGTGTLFAKLSEAGKALGVGQSEALRLTETVNQAIQLSGASAQASEAAVTELIQGLQGGVLRGDEFNSVMEQSPRLARALADGLGKTTGELRKMAEAGQLSSDVVIKALQGQSDAVETEFNKLPPTVGRAIQNLSTSWTLYVGETDKATGASKAAAKAIDALANNLSTIAGYLVDAGQAAAAFTAIKLAQHFLGIGTAAAQATASVVANTAAVSAAGTASTGAAASVGRFASILSSLKLFSVLGIVTNFKDIGTAIGEAAARLVGYKDRTDEIARSDKLSAELAAITIAMRRRMAAATQEAIDKQFELSTTAKTAIAEFDKLTKAGDTSSEAIAKIGKDFDLKSSPGIRDASAVLDKLAADGKLSASDVQQAWAKALDGKDLAVFEVMAKAAFAGTAREAERLAQVSGAVLQEAIKRTGLDFQVISGGMGKAAASAINDTDAIIQGLEKLKLQGIDAAQVLTASIGKGISTADSQQAIDALRAQIEAVRKVLGDRVADGLLDQAEQKAFGLKDALDAAKPGVDSLREAMKNLGVVSDQALKDSAKAAKESFDALRTSGTASLRELQDGFKAYAQKAIAANGGVATEALKVEAAMAKVSIQTDQTGKAIVSSLAKGADAIKTTEDAYRQLGLKAPDELNKIAEANAAAWNKIKGDSSASAETLQKAFSTYAQSAINASGDVGSSQRRTTEELLKQEAALKGLTIKFDEHGRIIVRGQKDVANAVSDVTTALEAQNAAQERIISAQERSNALAERAVALENKRRGQDSSGFAANAKGERIVAGGDLNTATGVFKFLQEAGVKDEAKAREITKEFLDSQGNVQYSNNPGQIKYGGTTISDALFKAAERVTFGTGGTGVATGFGGAGAASPGTASTTQAAPAQPNSTITHRFQIGGATTSVGVASPSDSAALVSVIKQLESARRSANG